MAKNVIQPQEGTQEQFLSSPADIAIMGGAAGGGKTFGLLMEPTRHFKVKNATSVIFRRTMPEITRPGGLWDESLKLYYNLNATPNIVERKWYLPTLGNTISFGGLQYDESVEEWKSAQIMLLMFDQLETFTEKQFFYMLSRNRSTCGVAPYCRATANPEPGWLADFLAWWIDKDGYANLERSGKIRWMVRVNDQIEWADTREELLERYADIPGIYPYSVTFILSTVYDNKKLLEVDPGYLARLMLLPLVERERLLGDPKRGGNWTIKPSAGKVFNRTWFDTVMQPPNTGTICLYLDFAGSEKKTFKDDPDYTCGIAMIMDQDEYTVVDMLNKQLAPSRVDMVTDEWILRWGEYALHHGYKFFVRWENEPGSASLRDSAARSKRLAGIDAKGVSKRVDKITAWGPLSSKAENGLVHVLKTAWTEFWLNNMHGAPDLPHDDIPDATSGAYSELAKYKERKKSYSSEG